MAVGPKTAKKLQAFSIHEMTYASLESHVSRLVYASAILGVHLPKYYFVIKNVRRRLSALTRGLVLPTDRVTLSPSATAQLREWTDVAVQNKPVTPQRHPAHSRRMHVLYTDASKAGWGAVLFENTGQVFAAGGPWPPSFTYENNLAETRAVALALSAFDPRFVPGTTLSLKVDNTSAEAAVNRGMSQSEGVSSALAEVLAARKRSDIAVTAEYVNTSENVADAVSRGVTEVWRKGCDGESRGGDFTPFTLPSNVTVNYQGEVPCVLVQ